MWCWWETDKFLWNGGQYNDFNKGKVTRDPVVVLLGTYVSLVSSMQFFTWLIWEGNGGWIEAKPEDEEGEGNQAGADADSAVNQLESGTADEMLAEDKKKQFMARKRLELDMGVLMGSAGMLAIAVLFVMAGIWIMIIDIVAMGYYTWVCFQRVQDSRKRAVYTKLVYLTTQRIPPALRGTSVRAE